MYLHSMAALSHCQLGQRETNGCKRRSSKRVAIAKHSYCGKSKAHLLVKCLVISTTRVALASVWLTIAEAEQGLVKKNPAPFDNRSQVMQSASWIGHV
jgi:hypothetical protein